MYRQNGEPFDISGKIIIIVDDGIATGFTIQLAIKTVSKQKPEKIIVAVPVAPIETINEIEDEGIGRVILLEPPKEFMGAVGAHYQEFEQIEDEEVIKLLNA